MTVSAVLEADPCGTRIGGHPVHTKYGGSSSTTTRSSLPQAVHSSMSTSGPRIGHSTRTPSTTKRCSRCLENIALPRGDGEFYDLVARPLEAANIEDQPREEGQCHDWQADRDEVGERFSGHRDHHLEE